VVFHVEAVTVGATSVRILTFTKKRTYFLIKNNGTATIYLLEDSKRALANGFPLAPGEIYPPTWDYGIDPAIDRYAISNVAGQDVRLIEEFRDEGKEDE